MDYYADEGLPSFSLKLVFESFDTLRTAACFRLPSYHHPHASPGHASVEKSAVDVQSMQGGPHQSIYLVPAKVTTRCISARSWTRDNTIHRTDSQCSKRISEVSAGRDRPWQTPRIISWPARPEARRLSTCINYWTNHGINTSTCVSYTVGSASSCSSKPLMGTMGA